METVLREVEQSLALREFLRGRVPDGDGPGCAPCCKWILEDLDRHGKLTGWPLDSMNTGVFPVDGKILHLAAELRVEERIDGDRVKTVKDLLPFIRTRILELGRA